MNGSHHVLENLTYVEVERLLAGQASTVAIIPAGSVEAHGPHLPLCTDTLISVEVAQRAAVALAARGLVAIRFPALSYGVTDWAAGFAGTTSISADVIESLVLETATSAHTAGFARVVLTNAHLEPGHIKTLRRVCARFEQATGQPLLFPDKTRRAAAARLTEEFRSGSCHAGQYETSLILAIRPDLVDKEAASSLPAHRVPLHERIAAGAQNFAQCGLEHAYCGDPAAATAEEGEQSLAILRDMVVEAVTASLSSD